MEVGIYIHVRFVVRHVVKRGILQNINAYIVVSALLLVICVVRHSVKRAVLKHINAYIEVSDQVFIRCVIRHSVIVTL
jgi:hypothetical protein